VGSHKLEQGGPLLVRWRQIEDFRDSALVSGTIIGVASALDTGVVATDVLELGKRKRGRWQNAGTNQPRWSSSTAEQSNCSI